MASILDLLNTQMGEELVKKASSKTSEDKGKVTSALGMALPLILGAMKRNTKDPEGAENLDKALQSEKHNGDVLNNLEEKDAEELTGEGSKILNHVLGSRQSGISKTIAGALNMDESSVNKILEMVAPVIMGLLSQQKRKDNVGASGLSGLLGSVMGSNSSHDQSLVETLLDADGDGSVIDDVAGMVLGGKKGKKGGSLLGGMLGGK
ncbi:DUF937 domain-containing protein [Salegentibacter salarius]|uniref:DUF937 domain-containing protein n=1 Tax=Salegentibacter salarius TaxID=435906 RepID=A0A2N0U2W7_9FLAO|nr:DUF937 domain-containing protein [Salegentibacter salarius]OEY71182.1 hypothetical protein BHS39_06800 [Salegentibacter salarius]PKD21337.1 hypothetical protein APR40_06795 [Salegentibacter salarius]SLJ93173.1 protein of unknown function [Salegentibacter salarius]